MKNTVYVQIIAFDKNSNNNIGRSIVASTKKDFNRQVEEFENEVPYSKFYIEIISDCILTKEQEEITADYDIS